MTRELHPKARRLTWEQACEVRRLRGLNRFKWTHKALAEHFGVGKTVIAGILHYRNYNSPRERFRFINTPESLRERWRKENRRKYARRRSQAIGAAL